MKTHAISGSACQGLQLTTVRNASEILKLIDVYLNRSSRTEDPFRVLRKTIDAAIEHNVEVLYTPAAVDDVRDDELAVLKVSREALRAAEHRGVVPHDRFARLRAGARRRAQGRRR